MRERFEFDKHVIAVNYLEVNPVKVQRLKCCYLVHSVWFSGNFSRLVEVLANSLQLTIVTTSTPTIVTV